MHISRLGSPRNLSAQLAANSDLWRFVSLNETSATCAVLERSWKARCRGVEDLSSLQNHATSRMLEMKILALHWNLCQAILSRHSEESKSLTLTLSGA